MTTAPEPAPFRRADDYVSERVAIEMRRRRLTQIATADALGMGQSTLSKKLGGERAWSLDELLVISRYFQIDIADLMPDADYQPVVQRQGVRATPCYVLTDGNVVDLQVWRSRRSRRRTYALPQRLADVVALDGRRTA